MRARQRFSQVFVFVAAIFILGCGSSRLTTRQANEELQPRAPLPEREQAQLPENLFIRIENVADEGGSYKNYATLRINGREIAPDEAVSNFTSDYDFALRLQYGIYEIEGEYHVVGFWKEVSYPIRTDEPVKIMPGKKALLTAHIEKDWHGFPIEKSMRFALRYEDLPTGAAVGVLREAVAPVSVSFSPARSVVSKEPVLFQEQFTKPAPIAGEPPEESVLKNPQSILLQINTTPSNAEVIVDDRFCGNTPLRVTVTRGERHVVQVSRQGFVEVLRIIEPQELTHGNTAQLVFKLEAVAEEKK